ncbi:hypothetical protein BV25DRAFT_30487 [Artomyces pyxidatus]|uniref:Uncharacterized protein n=1 Tax=Artomyces pyxidatus TaxID=48021 RepID=A0ACB8TJU6_9AGAM|nr:hypothetical protein BV25DRAFT_30487 [Artomyces pyxidatus]
MAVGSKLEACLPGRDDLYWRQFARRHNRVSRWLCREALFSLLPLTPFELKDLSVSAIDGLDIINARNGTTKYAPFVTFFQLQGLHASFRQVDSTYDLLLALSQSLLIYTQPAGPTATPTMTNFSVSTPTRLTDRASRMSLGLAGMPGQRLIIRADPAMTSCFDPADKELYDLWARNS